MCDMTQKPDKNSILTCPQVSAALLVDLEKCILLAHHLAYLISKRTRWDTHHSQVMALSGETSHVLMTGVPCISMEWLGLQDLLSFLSMVDANLLITDFSGPSPSSMGWSMQMIQGRFVSSSPLLFCACFKARS